MIFPMPFLKINIQFQLFTEYILVHAYHTKGMLHVTQGSWIRRTAHFHIYLSMASTIYPCGFPDDREKDPAQQ